jgi:predicted CoA-binding protein
MTETTTASGRTRLEKLLEKSQDRHNPTTEELEGILDSSHAIAVVGMSTNPAKPARRVPSYLAAHGYEIIPVNPTADRILGKPARNSLAEVTEPVDVVLVFRPSQEAAKVIEAAASRPERPVIWLQEGIRADEEASRARGQGIQVIQDLCAYKAHKALHGED